MAASNASSVRPALKAPATNRRCTTLRCVAFWAPELKEALAAERSILLTAERLPGSTGNPFRGKVGCGFVEPP
jgi:hypothetical protein